MDAVVSNSTKAVGRVHTNGAFDGKPRPSRTYRYTDLYELTCAESSRVNDSDLMNLSIVILLKFSHLCFSF